MLLLARQKVRIMNADTEGKLRWLWENLTFRDRSTGDEGLNIVHPEPSENGAPYGSFTV